MKKPYSFLLVCLLPTMANAKPEASNTGLWERGALHMNLSVLAVNNTKLNIADAGWPATGFLTPAIGLGYCYKERRFITTQVGVVRASNAIIAMDVREDTNSYKVNKVVKGIFVNVMNNHVCTGNGFNNLTVGYGVGFNAFAYTQRQADTTKANGRRRQVGEGYYNSGICLPLSMHYQVFKAINVGLLYQPHLLSFSKGFQYEHTLSLSVLFRIGLNSKR